MLRITAGEFRGRRLRVPAVAATRPLIERAREGLMNHLAPLLPDAVVWDVYAGSGVLGFEALSRGARQVIAVEKDRRAIRRIEEIASDLGVSDRLRLVCDDAHRLPSLAAAGRLGESPDIVFFDPPYADFRGGGEPREKTWSLFVCLAGLLASSGCAVVHTPRSALVSDESEQLPGLVQRDYGSTSLYWWHRS